MLKTSSTKLVKPKKGGVGVNGRVEHNKSEIDGGEIDGGKVKNDQIGKKGQKTFKSKNLSKSKQTVGLDFFTLRARLAFTKLR